MSDITLSGGQSAGRLYVKRSAADIPIADLTHLPECCGRGIGTGLKKLRSEAGSRRQAAAHQRRALQSRAAPVRTPRVPVNADRGVYLIMEWRSWETQKTRRTQRTKRFVLLHLRRRYRLFDVEAL